jgi:hypothetical protein
MANFPTLEELNNVFFNEADCISYLMQENVLFIRENCSFCLSIVRIEEKFWRCTNKEKRFQFLKIHYYRVLS